MDARSSRVSSNPDLAFGSNDHCLKRRSVTHNFFFLNFYRNEYSVSREEDAWAYISVAVA